MRKYLKVGELIKACEAHQYLLLKFPSGYVMGINTGISKIALKKKKYKYNEETTFIGFKPCDFHRYITHKHVFKKH